jgi:dihydrofolate reductase
MIIGIVAVDKNGAIGKGGRLPWHYPADMKFFRETTTGNACVMGHKTWLTLGKPLKDRLNIVLSRQSDVEAQDCLVVLRHSEFALSLNKYLAGDLFVIGGATIYEAFLPHIEQWIVTEVPLVVEGADAFMPVDFLDGFKDVGSRQLDNELVVKFYVRTEER